MLSVILDFLEIVFCTIGFVLVIIGLYNIFCED